MAQKNLFKMQTKGGKEADSQILGAKKQRKAASDITYVSGDKYRDAITRARSISHKILGKLLDRFELVTEEERVIEYFENIKKVGMVALDTETTGLDTMHDRVAGMSLYTEGEKGIYIPLNHISHMTHGLLKQNISVEFIRKKLQELVDSKVKFIYHNAKFDMGFVYWQIGIHLGEPFWDTLVASHLLNENESHNLKVLHMKYVLGDPEDAQTAKFNSLFKGIDFTLIPPDVGYMYASYDPIMTWELFEFQQPYLTVGTEECNDSKLDRVSWVFHNIEMPLITVLLGMEIRGLSIDNEYLEELKIKFGSKMNEAEERFKEVVSYYEDDLDKLRISDYEKYAKLEQDRGGKVTVSISSPIQLAILLYDVLGLESSDKNKPRGTGDAILSAMDHPVIETIKTYRTYAKLMSTYMSMDKHQSKIDGKVHTNYKQNGAATGRMSSEEPNVQNIPAKGEGKVVRQIFIPSPGHKLLGSDYSQQEPRSLASLSGDENMIRAYKEGKDLYAVIGAKVYKVKYEDCLEFNADGSNNPEGKKRRSNTKSILLGIMYGRGSAAVAEQTGLSKKEAEKIISDFFKEFPKVGEYIIKVQQQAIDIGYVETADGRRRRLPDMQLEEYTVESTGDGKSENFDPFNFDGESEDLDYVPQEVFEKYSNLMSRAWGFKQKLEVKEKAKQEGYIVHDNGGKIADAERQCLNSVIQGTAASMSKLAMIRVANDERLKELGFSLSIPVHDELIGEAPDANAFEAAERLAEVMIGAAAELINVPMKCDGAVFERWGGEELDPPK